MSSEYPVLQKMPPTQMYALQFLDRTVFPLVQGSSQMLCENTLSEVKCTGESWDQLQQGPIRDHNAAY